MADIDAALDAGLAKSIRDSAEQLRQAVANAKNAGLSVTLNFSNSFGSDEKVDPKAIRVTREY